MSELTCRVLNLALADYVSWRATGVTLPVVVKASSCVINKADLVDMVRRYRDHRKVVDFLS
jgi:Ni2+-binding GTPase involved in maturation of urease and hydrogenase